MKALILNDYGTGEDYATYIYKGIKTIETRMGRLFSHRGDIAICKGKSKSVGENRGMALCVVNIWHGRMMKQTDEDAACIAFHPQRRSLLLKDWQYFNRMFEFAPHATTKNFQGIFDIKLPPDIYLLPQPQIKGFEEIIQQPCQLFNN